MPCPYLSIETENVLGTHQGNLTKNVRKWKLKTKGAVQRRLKEHPVQEVEHIQVQEVAPPPPPPAEHKAGATPLARAGNPRETFARPPDDPRWPLVTSSLTSLDGLLLPPTGRLALQGRL